MSTRYSIAIHRIKDAERSQNPTEQLSWAGNEMASIIREGDPLLVDSPITWAGLAMVHQAQHEIAASFESEQKELMEVEEHANSTLKQVGSNPCFFKKSASFYDTIHIGIGKSQAIH